MICFTHYRGFYTLRKWLHYFSAFTFKTIVALIVVLCISSLCHGQSTEITSDSGEDEISPLRVGEKVPEDFWTREHLFYADGDTIRKSLEEYKGKLLVLDFWATWCGACRSSMPIVLNDVENFKGKVSLLLVNSTHYKDSYDTIHKCFIGPLARLGVKNQASIINDEKLVAHFPHISLPFYVWLDPFGRVLAYTGTGMISKETISYQLRHSKY